MNAWASSRVGPIGGSSPPSAGARTSSCSPAVCRRRESPGALGGSGGSGVGRACGRTGSVGAGRRRGGSCRTRARSTEVRSASPAPSCSTSLRGCSTPSAWCVRAACSCSSTCLSTPAARCTGTASLAVSAASWCTSATSSTEPTCERHRGRRGGHATRSRAAEGRRAGRRSAADEVGRAADLRVDPLSSVAYATEAALVVLLAASASSAYLVFPLSLGSPR